MCKYCEDKELIIDYKNTADVFNLTSLIRGGNTKTWVEGSSLCVMWEAQDDFYRDKQTAKINYCPMCGRKLSEEA